jgi:hypothetical protein
MFVFTYINENLFCFVYLSKPKQFNKFSARVVLSLSLVREQNKIVKEKGKLEQKLVFFKNRVLLFHTAFFKLIKYYSTLDPLLFKNILPVTKYNNDTADICVFGV